MRNPHRDSKAKKIGIIALAICAFAYLIGMEWHYWPHRWPSGSTSSWHWWDWLWVTVLLGAAPFAIMLRIRRWASWLDLKENIRMRKADSRPNPTDHDDSDSSSW